MDESAAQWIPDPNSRVDVLARLHIDIADTFWARFLGLMGSSRLPVDHALLIKQCSSVHTCFMRYPIDLVFLDSGYRVTETASAIKPWRLHMARAPAKHVLELAAGGIERLGLRSGQMLSGLT
jgi:uncharacterized protein